MSFDPLERQALPPDRRLRDRRPPAVHETAEEKVVHPFARRAPSGDEKAAEDRPAEDRPAPRPGKGHWNRCLSVTGRGTLRP
ncbi:hypothetical protein [Streptomyces sp. NPDC090057]|uniref:hypothetical protein n=1 Tax=Streptomyces sp. NPDC090057 TaxID=3365935 RepID=UPI00380B4967